MIGVDDQTKEIIGINDTMRDKMYDYFPNSLSIQQAQTYPTNYEQRIGDKEVMVIGKYLRHSKNLVFYEVREFLKVYLFESVLYPCRKSRVYSGINV